VRYSFYGYFEIKINTTMRSLLIVILMALLMACSSDREYFLQTSDARGVEVGAAVYRQGINIGSVTAVAFDEQDVKITISTDGPLYEDQEFTILPVEDGEIGIQFGQPSSNAQELAAGGTLVQEDDYLFESDLGLEAVFGKDGEKLEAKFEEAFGKDGEKLKARFEEAFGKDGEKLEAKFEEMFGKDGEKLEAKFEELFGKDGEKLEAQFEELFGKDGEKLEAKLQEMFGEDGEKLKGMAESLGTEFEDLGNRIEAVNQKYEKDSPEWKREMQKAVREWTESKE
jgi:hypothetical protein